MSVYDDILVELRVLRGKLDAIAAMAQSEKAREELLPIWQCGHRHASRGEAILCRRRSDNLRPATLGMEAANELG